MTKETLPGIHLFDLRGKVAIITGGSKGLGLAMAAGLASAGASIMLISRNGEEGMLSAKDLSKTYEAKVSSFSADVTDHHQVDEMVKATLEKFGKIDILINSRSEE